MYLASWGFLLFCFFLGVGLFVLASETGFLCITALAMLEIALVKQLALNSQKSTSE